MMWHSFVEVYERMVRGIVHQRNDCRAKDIQKEAKIPEEEQ
jgi:hypothetical protein